MRCSTTAGALLIAITLQGCQHRPTIQYPKLVDAGSIEGRFDCAALDDAVLKTEAVRWVMRQDGARLRSPDARAARTATDIAAGVAASLACPLCFSPANLGDEGHAALDRADRRLLSLLKLKNAGGCDSRNTAIAGMSDLEMYEVVVTALVSDEQRKPVNRPIGELRAERMRLFDGLRPRGSQPYFADSAFGVAVGAASRFQMSRGNFQAPPSRSPDHLQHTPARYRRAICAKYAEACRPPPRCCHASRAPSARAPGLSPPGNGALPQGRNLVPPGCPLRIGWQGRGIGRIHIREVAAASPRFTAAANSLLAFSIEALASPAPCPKHTTLAAGQGRIGDS